jgi:hypothetical protein
MISGANIRSCVGAAKGNKRAYVSALQVIREHVYALRLIPSYLGAVTLVAVAVALGLPAAASASAAAALASGPKPDPQSMSHVAPVATAVPVSAQGASAAATTLASVAIRTPSSGQAPAPDPAPTRPTLPSIVPQPAPVQPAPTDGGATRGAPAYVPPGESPHVSPGPSVASPSVLTGLPQDGTGSSPSGWSPPFNWSHPGGSPHDRSVTGGQDGSSPNDTTPGPQPAAGSSTPSGGNAAATQTTPPTLPTRQAEADGAGDSWPATTSANQTGPAPSLGNQVQTLLANAEMSVREDSATGALALPSQQLGTPGTVLGAVAGHTALVNAGHGLTLPGLTVTGAAEGASGRAGSAGLELTGPAATAAGEPQQGPAHSRQEAPAHRAAHAPHATEWSTIVPASPLFVDAAQPSSTSLAGGAAAGSSAGGVGSGAAAAALLAVAALWLLAALLPGRLALDLFPWQSAMLALRLERPG